DHSSGDQHIHEENASGTATGLTPSERESSPKISLFEALASREKGGGSALVDVKRTGRLSGMARDSPRLFDCQLSPLGSAHARFRSRLRLRPDPPPFSRIGQDRLHLASCRGTDR